MVSVTKKENVMLLSKDSHRAILFEQSHEIVPLDLWDYLYQRDDVGVVKMSHVLAFHHTQILKHIRELVPLRL